ncbi:MAG: hypothetical protein HYV97_12445 [Bdellovibrio sp.]|nr:hypothetical protein [Bdellovibrio sp.]
MTTLGKLAFCKQGQVSVLGLLVLMAVLSSTISTVAQMHWLLLRMKARAQVYLCHIKAAGEIEQHILFIGRTNFTLRSLSLASLTPATTAQALALKKGIQLSQKIHTAAFLQKLQATNECSLKNVINLARQSPYRNFRRHPVDGTLLLEKPVWNYQLRTNIRGINLLRTDYEIQLRGSFSLRDRFGNFSKGKLNEIL